MAVGGVVVGYRREEDERGYWVEKVKTLCAERRKWGSAAPAQSAGAIAKARDATDLIPSTRGGVEERSISTMVGQHRLHSQSSSWRLEDPLSAAGHGREEARKRCAREVMHLWLRDD